MRVGVLTWCSQQQFSVTGIDVVFFGGFFEDVMASVRLIPNPKEPLLLPKEGSGGCVHCAVVGTAGILNGSKMGKEIDAHDYIFR